MDENGVTYLCDLVDSGENESVIDQTLPMYLIMVSGGIPGAMLRLSAGGYAAGTVGRQHLPVARDHHLAPSRIIRPSNPRGSSG